MKRNKQNANLLFSANYSAGFAVGSFKKGAAFLISWCDMHVILAQKTEIMFELSEATTGFKGWFSCQNFYFVPNVIS